MDKLTALQNGHRLAVHIQETGKDNTQVAQGTIDLLNKIPAEEIDASLQNGRPKLHSMTLLPASNAQASIETYGCFGGQRIEPYGYLFDLSQDTPHPAKVVRANLVTLFSNCITSTDKHAKHLRLTSLVSGKIDGVKQSNPKKIIDFYTQFRPELPPKATASQRKLCAKIWKKNLLQAIGGEQGSTYTEQQLDLLGDYYTHAEHFSRKDLEENTSKPIAQLNEILVAASTPHIAAIAVPMKSGNIHIVRLQAALLGLEHITKGHHWPVVLYHVAGPDQCKLTYVGQEKEELRKVAIQELYMLIPKRAELHLFHGIEGQRYHELSQAIKRELDIDVSLPADDPDGWKTRIEALNTPLTPATPSPSPPRRRTSPESDGRY